MAALHPADWIILGVIVISFALGFFRGFVREAFSLAGWVSAYVVARLFHAPLENLLADSISTPSLRLAAAWGGLFVTTLMLAMLAGYLVLSVIESAGLRSVDRFLGAGFGVVRGLILVLAVLVMVSPFASRDAWWKNAMLPKQFLRFEAVGRDMKDKVVQAARQVGNKETDEVPAAAGNDN
ncbi:MAG: CvpA family protein [Moraxellaceae bacterium]